MTCASNLTDIFAEHVCRLLECQMQEQERVHDEKYQKLLEEANKLRAEKEQQQKLLTQSLVLPEDARIEASLKHEITRLTNENLVGPAVEHPKHQCDSVCD